MKIYIFIFLLLIQFKGFSQEVSQYNPVDYSFISEPIILDLSKPFTLIKEQILVVSNQTDSFLNFEYYRIDSLFFLEIRYSDSNEVISINSGTQQYIGMILDNSTSNERITLQVRTANYRFKFIIYRNLRLTEDVLDGIQLSENEKRISKRLNQSVQTKKRALVYIKDLIVYP